MAKDNEFEFLSDTGSQDYTIAGGSLVTTALQKKIAKFLLDVQSNARDWKLINKGKLISDRGYNVKVYQDGALTIGEVYMIYYGMFQNYGVKGWGSARNAPNSPYSFKTKGMDDEGKASIKAMILRRKKIVRNVQYKKEGLETKAPNSANSKRGKGKRISVKDSEVNRAIWNIKKYGIKEKPFFTDAWQKNFGTFDNELFTAIKNKIIAEFKKPSK